VRSSLNYDNEHAFARLPHKTRRITPASSAQHEWRVNIMHSKDSLAVESLDRRQITRGTMRLLILFFVIVLVSPGNGQSMVPSIIDSSAVTIVTKVPLNGTNYFITIVPVDSTNIDNMPIVGPNHRVDHVYPLIDSIKLNMLPDSILKLLPPNQQDYFTRGQRQAQFIRGFGLKVGAVSATQTWQYWSNSQLSTDPRWGFDAGIFVEALDLPFLSVLAELHYVQKGFTNTLPVTTEAQPDGTGEEITFRPRVDYLSLPILAKIRFDVGFFTPYVFAGPRVDFLLTNTDDGFGLVLDKFKKTDVGVSIGMGVELPLSFVSHLLAEFRFSPSLTEAFKNGSLKVKNQSIELFLGVELQ
jgi:hypothetical protein